MARRRLREIVIMAGAFLAGSVVASLTAGPALFADGLMVERFLALGASFAIFLALGFALGSLAPASWKIAATMLVLPVVPVTVLFGSDVADDWVLAALAMGFPVGGFAVALYGAWVGRRMLERRNQRALGRL